jgi:hypothetical protein
MGSTSTAKAAKTVKTVSSAKRVTRTTGSKAAKAREFVVKYIAHNGVGPTYTQVQKATNVGDTTQVFRKLAEDGVITYKRGDYTTARLCTGSARPLVEASPATAAEGLIKVKLPASVLAVVHGKLLDQRTEIDEQIRALEAAIKAAG